MVGLDRRQRPVLGPAHAQHVQGLRPPEDDLLAPVAPAKRGNRWRYLGLVNEPCFEQATGPDPERFGLWLDKRRADCPPDPFADAGKYPGVATGARGRNLPVGSYYGEPTGILGLRLFPNPAFDEEAAKRWDPARFYEDPGYYNSKISCGPTGSACPAASATSGPARSHPGRPREPEVGERQLDGRRAVFLDRPDLRLEGDTDPANYMCQLVHTQRPGTLDTSLVSTDYINNPRTMNAIYNLGARLEIAKRWGQERLAGEELDNKQFNDFFDHGPLTEFFRPPDGLHRACSRTAPIRWALWAPSTAFT